LICRSWYHGRSCHNNNTILFLSSTQVAELESQQADLQAKLTSLESTSAPAAAATPVPDAAAAAVPMGEAAEAAPPPPAAAAAAESAVAPAEPEKEAAAVEQTGQYLKNN
jgi:hypothetical protein